MIAQTAMKSRATVALLLGAWGSSMSLPGCGDRGSRADVTDAGAGGATATGGAGGGTGGAGGRISCPSDCLPGACLPIPLATGLFAPRGLAIDATAVYFTNTNADTVMKVDKVGGAPVVIVPHRFTSAEQPWGLAVTGGYLYWVAFFRGFIARSGLGGEDPIELAESEGYAKEIAVDETSIYWTRPGMIRKMGRGGGAPVTLIATNAQDLAADGSSVYWTQAASIGGGAVMRMGLGGESPTALASGLSSPRGLALDASSVYWADDGDRTVRKVSLAGGAVTTLATAPGSPAFVAVDSAAVYWTIPGAIPGEGSVMKVGLQGGAAVTLASGQPGPTRIVLDGCHVYWLDASAGAIMKVPK